MPNIVAQIALTLDDAGQVSVNSNTDNLVHIFGLLEMAKVAFQKHHDAQSKRIVELPPGSKLRPVQ